MQLFCARVTTVVSVYITYSSTCLRYVLLSSHISSLLLQRFDFSRPRPTVLLIHRCEQGHCSPPTWCVYMICDALELGIRRSCIAVALAMRHKQVVYPPIYGLNGRCHCREISALRPLPFYCSHESRTCIMQPPLSIQNPNVH